MSNLIDSKYGYLKYQIILDGENISGGPQKHWFLLAENGLLTHSIRKQHVDLFGEFIQLGHFTSVEPTESTPNFILSSKIRNIDIHFSAESIEDRNSWIEAIRKEIPKARKKLKETERGMSSPKEVVEISGSPVHSLNVTSLNKAKKLMSSELTQVSTATQRTLERNGASTIYKVFVKVSEAKLTDVDIKDPEAFVVVNIDSASYRTRTLAKSSSPLWAEETSLIFKDPMSSMLRVSVWDERSSKENILGKCDISLSALTPNAPSFEEWYSLTYASNNAYVSGELHIRLDTTHKDTMGVIFLTVIEGRNLPLRTRASTEIYVKATMGKQTVKTKSFKTIDRTSLVQALQASSEAEWNESLELKIDSGLSDIVLSLHKPTSSSSIGKVTLKPSLLPVCFDGWMDLEIDDEIVGKELSKGAARDKVGDIRIGLRMEMAIVYPLEYYDPLVNLLMDTEQCAQLVYLFEKITTKPDDRVNVAVRLVHIYEAKNKAPVILKALLSREIQLASDVETLFRANSLASKAIDMYMKISAHRYLQYCVQDTIDTIYKESSKKNFEIEPIKLDKTDDIRKNWKYLTKCMDALLKRIYEGVNECPPGLREIFHHLQAEVEKKFSDPMVRYTGVSSFLFLRFIVAAILGPKLFNLAPDHPSPKISANLTVVAKIVQRIANMTPMDFTLKEYQREREFYIEKQKGPMQAFIDAVSTPGSTDDFFDPAAVDLKQELSFIHAHCESHLHTLADLAAEPTGESYGPAISLLSALDKMASASIKPRPNVLLKTPDQQYVLNPDRARGRQGSGASEDRIFNISEDETEQQQTRSTSIEITTSKRKSTSRTNSSSNIRKHKTSNTSPITSSLPGTPSRTRTGRANSGNETAETTGSWKLPMKHFPELAEEPRSRSATLAPTSGSGSENEEKKSRKRTGSQLASEL